MLRSLFVAAAVVLLIVTGIVHGLWTDRWQVSPAIEAAAHKVEGLPAVVGDWEGEPLQLNPKELTRGGIVGHAAYRYKHRYTGAVVTVALLCGRPGHLAVHTPDVCYAAIGFHFTTTPVRYPVEFVAGTPPAEFLTGKLEKPGSAGTEQLRIFWGWTATGGWQAPEDPRLTFAREQVLFKLYVLHEVRPGDNRPEDDPSVDLLRQLLPAMNAAVFHADHAS
jgi:hypothetical protein